MMTMALCMLRLRVILNTEEGQLKSQAGSCPCAKMGLQNRGFMIKVFGSTFFRIALMAGRRPERLGEQLKEEVNQIILGELNDPRIGLVTVTGVEVSSDLR